MSVGYDKISGFENKRLDYTDSPDVFFADAKRQTDYDEPDLDNFIDNLNEWN